MKVAFSWLKKNTKTVIFIILAVLVVLLSILAFWFKLRGFKIADLIYKLREAEANNEISHLETKKAVLAERETQNYDDIEDLNKLIQAERKKVEVAKRKIKRMSTDEIAAELTDLGF